MKVVTICGSMKFKDKMMEVTRDLEIKNKYVVNVDSYIGTSTKKEIEYAKSLNKKIIYMK